MRCSLLLLHAIQRLTICSKISLAILAVSALIYLTSIDDDDGSYYSSEESFNRTAVLFFGSDNDASPRHHHHNSRKVADMLAHSVRILCVCSALNSGELCLEHPRETWGRRCTDWLYIYEDLNTPYNVTLQQRTNDTIVSYTLEQPIYPWLVDQFADRYDWILRTTETAYVVMENLRVFLGQFDPDESHLFGYELKNNFVLDTAYVFSRGALRRLVDEAMRPLDPRKATCLKPTVIDDLLDEHLIAGHCFRSINVFPEDSRDELGRNRFILRFNVWDWLVEGATVNKSQLWLQDKYLPSDGRLCCSDSAFVLDAGGHHGFVLAFEWFLYRLHPSGVTVTHLLPENANLNRLISKFKAKSAF